jgi:hypothetical protein
VLYTATAENARMLANRSSNRAVTTADGSMELNYIRDVADERMKGERD